MQNKFYLAESEVRTVLKYDANSKEAEFLMGRILEMKGLFKEARKHYYRVLKKDHQHGEAMAALQRLSSKVSDQYWMTTNRGMLGTMSAIASKTFGSG